MSLFQQSKLRILLLSCFLFASAFFFYSPTTFAVGDVCQNDATCCTPPQSVIDGGGCPAGKYWIGPALGGKCTTSATTCANPQKFSCTTGACTPLPAAPATCTGGKIHVGGGSCWEPLHVLRQNAADTIYKLFRGEYLGNLVYLPEGTTCAANEVIGWDGSKWGCAKGGLWTPSPTVTDAIYYSTGEVGIGTDAPNANLSVIGTANVGAGNKSLGAQSFSTGFISTAEGMRSLAAGFAAWAKGNDSVALGSSSKAYGHVSIAGGLLNETGCAAGSNCSTTSTTPAAYNSLNNDGEFAVALGSLNKATGKAAVALGGQNAATGYNSFAAGFQSKAQDDMAIALGYRAQANGEAAVSMGKDTIAKGWSSVALGQNITVNGHNSVGIGLSSGSVSTITNNGTMAVMGGKVGIGKVNPSEIFEVNGRMKIDGTAAGTWIEAGANDWFVGRGGAGNTQLRFYNNGDKIVFENDGDLRIGGANLYIWNQEVLSTTGGTVDVGGAMVSRFHKQVVIDNSGFGTSSDPNYMLTVNVADNTNGLSVQGFGGSILSCTSGGCNGVSASGNGNDFYASGPGTNYGSASSIRWKKDVVEIPNALDKVSDLRGVTYTWDEEHGGQADMGMIAEEVYKVVPEVVTLDPDDSQYANGMDYGALTPLLTEAIKELKAEKDIEILELKNRISELESR